MAKNFWESDKPAGGGEFWASDKPADEGEFWKADAPAEATTGAKQADMRSVNAPAIAQPKATRAADAEIDQLASASDPMGTGAAEIMAAANPRRESVLEGVQLPEPKFDPAEAQRLSRRDYAESHPVSGTEGRSGAVMRPAGEVKPADPMFERGAAIRDASLPVRAAFKAVSGVAKGAGGVLRSAGDLTGIPQLTAAGQATSAGADQFEQGMGDAGPVAGFGQKSPVRYLGNMAEGAASSLGQSAMMASSFGPRAVIPLLSVMKIGQEYDRARNTGLEPAMALASAIPKGIFEAIGEKFTGLDKVAGAMGTLLTRGASEQAKHTAADVLVRAGIREVPGEIITYLGQTATDLLPGIGLNPDLTMGQFLDGLRDTTVQAAMMGGAFGSGGVVAKADPRIKRLREAGENEAADLLQKRQDQQDLQASVISELSGMQSDQTRTPEFQTSYIGLRADGTKPVEAAGRSALNAGFRQTAAAAGMSDKAIAAALEASRKISLDKLPGFLQRYTQGLASRGVIQAPDAALGTMLEAARDEAMDAALSSAYRSDVQETMDAVQALENQQNSLPAVDNTAPEAMNSVAPTESVQAVDNIEHILGQQTTRPDIDQAAHAAATSPLNDLPQPTQAQKEAGNYRKGHINLHGLNIAIENPQGSERRGVSPDGTEWSSTLASHYGYFKRTNGNDGDHVDTFIGPNPDSTKVFVVDQLNKDGSFDEHKVMLGFDSLEAADRGYHANYEPGWTGRGAITEVPLPAFKSWVRDGKKKEPISAIQFQTQEAGQGQEGTQPETAAAADQAANAGTDLEGNTARTVQPAAAADIQPGADQHPAVELSGKTPAQLAAMERAAKRLRLPHTGSGPLSAHAFIAAEGGLSRAAMADTGFDTNVRIGNRWLFAAQGKGLTLEQAAMKLAQAGYLPTESESDAADLIRRSMSQPQYTAEGWQALAEAEAATRYEDHLAAQQEADTGDDPLAPDGFTDAELEQSGYDDASPEVQAEVRALLATAEDKGIDAESVLENVAKTTENATQQVYYETAKRALESAIATEPGSEGDQRPPAGSESPAPGQEQGSGQVSQEPQQTPADAGVSVSGFTVEPRADGTLAIKGDAKAIRETLKAIPAKALVTMKGGILVGRTQAEKAQAILRGEQQKLTAREAAEAGERARQAEKKARQQAARAETMASPAGLSIGIMPSTAEAVTVRNGIVFIGDNEAIGYDSGEPVTVAADASDQQIVDVLKEAGALSRRQRVFGMAKIEGEGLTAPTREDVTAQQDRTARADELDQREQVRRESEAGASQFQLEAQDGRQDNTGDMFNQTAESTPQYASADMKALMDAGLELDNGVTPDKWVKKVSGLNDVMVDIISKPGEPVRAKIRAQRMGVDVAENEAEGIPAILENVKTMADGLEEYRRREGRKMMAESGLTEPGTAQQLPVAKDETGQKPMFARSKAPEVRDLLVQHNITADNLIHADRMGGMAVPSVAITKVDHPLHNFGEITLIGDKKMADPKAGLKVFGADIYSPRYPSINYKLDKKSVDKINAILSPFQEDGQKIYQGEIDRIDDLTGNKAFKAFVESTGGKAYRYGELKAAAKKMLEDAGAEERIFQGFTYSGNRRYTPHTLDNVIKILKKEIRGGENFNYGVGSLRAKFTPQFRSIDQIRKAKGNLLDKESFEAVKKEADDELISISNDLDLSLDQTIEVLEDSPKIGVTKAIARALKDYKQSDREVDDDVKQRVAQYLTHLRNMPTEYFEGKMLRGVGIGEFKAAVVPEGTKQQALDILEKNKLRVFTYKQGDDADRARAIREAAEETPDALFSRGQVWNSALQDGIESIQAKAKGSDAFSRMFAPPPAMPLSAVQKAVDELSATWTDGPIIKVVATSADLPIQAPADARGLIHKGTAYVVASNNPTLDFIARTLAHEAIGHYGLWKILGKDGKAKFERNLQLALKTGNKPLAKIRDKVRRLYVDDTGKFNLSPEEEANEIAAFAVEEAVDPVTGEFTTGMSWLKEFWARIADFLRGLGLPVKFTKTELHGLLVASMKGLQAGHRLDGGAEVLVATARSDKPVDLPDVIVGNPLGAATGLPDYAAAKAGDVKAAVKVARALVNDKLVEQVRAAIADAKPVIVPVVAEEAAGRNKIPLAAAEVLADRLGLDTETGVVQANRPHRTGMDGLDRLFAVPDFTGEILAGRDYLLMDDTLTQGATFAALASHIQQGGGRVVGAIALTGKQYSATIEPSTKALEQLRAKHGDIEQDFRAATGYGFDALTQSEARYLANYEPAQRLRDRVVEEGRRAREGRDPQADGGLNSSLARGAAAAMPPAGAPPIGTAKTGLFQPTIWETPDPTRADRIIYELQDGRVDLKRVQQAIEASGQKITEQWDTRLAETLYPGRVAYRAKAFLDTEVKPLLKSMAMNNVGMDELADYLHARGAEERNVQIAKVNPDMPDGGAGRNSKGMLMTTQAARNYLQAVSPERKAVLDAMAKRVDAITAGTRKLLVDQGLEKQETIDAWEAAYKNYVPMFRDEAETALPLHPQGLGFQVRGSASRRATGSTKEVTNILAHVLMQREAAITRAEKNRVALAMYGMALSHPNPEFWTTIKPGMSNAQIAAELQAMGVDPMMARVGMEGVPTIRTVDEATGKVIDRPNPLYRSLPGAIPLKVAGEDRVLMLNTTDERGARLAENLKNLDGLTRLDLANSIVGKATRWLASVNTQYNPAFGLVNLTRDTLGGVINLGSTELRGSSLKILADTPSAIFGIARELAHGKQTGKWGKLYRQFVADGGQTGYKELWRDPNDRARAIERELATEGKLTPGKAAHAILDLLDGFNTTLENAVRLAAYKEALDKGMSRAKAARLGRELTVDFNRKGRAGREVGPLYAFFNASVQGAARTIETIKGPTGAKIIAGGLSLGVLQALMLAAAGYDDDDLPEFVKSRALIIPLLGEEKRYIAIPYPLGLHVIPNTGRVLTELVLNGGKHIGKRSMEAIGEIAAAFNPLGGGNIFTAHGALTTAAPTVLDPIIDLTANKNFAGGTIERETRGEADNRPGAARARESTQRSTTGQVYIGISKAINAMTGGTAYEAGMASPTPERVRYLAQTVGGGVLRELEKGINASTAAARGDKVKSSQIPVIGRFYGSVDEDQVQTGRYYRNSDALRRLDSSFKAMEKAGDAAMEKLAKSNPELAMVPFLNEIQRSITELNKAAVLVIDDPKQMADIDAARAELMRSLNETVKKMEKASGNTTLADRLKPAKKPEPAAMK